MQTPLASVCLSTDSAHLPLCRVNNTQRVVLVADFGVLTKSFCMHISATSHQTNYFKLIVILAFIQGWSVLSILLCNLVTGSANPLV